MARKLVFIHGRAQERKDSIALKKEWIDSWRRGLDAAGLEMPVSETDIRFPYFGDTLEQLARGANPASAAAVIIRGTDLDQGEKRFANAIAAHIQKKFITEDQLASVAGREVVERGVFQWEWVQGVLQAIDRYVPGASATGIALKTHDVYQYLTNADVRATIDDGVMKAMEPDVETVVVAHSLGTVVAYRLLRQFGHKRGWRVRELITVGCPLGVKEIRETVMKWSPTRCPPCVDAWFNAYDTRDVVALYPLTTDYFPCDPLLPAIEEYDQVKNHTDNRHGIAGYLDDPVVARRIHDALI
ncbi:MAG: hypothetical protein ABI300_00415 [Rhodanobacter sp.]